LLGNFKDVVAQLEKQKAAIDQAIAALRAFDEGNPATFEAPKAGRPAKTVKKTGKKRVMSEEGRKRIAEASRKRWAAVRKAAKRAAA
jgi:hypothetical protein